MELYLSYDATDRAHGERLKQGLSVSAPQFGYTVWSMQDITPGHRWQEVMGQHLREARLFVPLVSADFLASDRCNAEVMGALQLARGGSLRIVPVLLRPCMWEYSALTGLHTLPANGREVTKWGSQDEAWMNVQRDLLGIVQSFLLA